MDRFDWCEVDVDLGTKQWRIVRRRVESLMNIPVPKDIEALSHVLGVLRYYYVGVADEVGQRDRLAELAKLDKLGVEY